MQPAAASPHHYIRQRLLLGGIELLPLAALPFIRYPWPVPLACAILPCILRQLSKSPLLRGRLTAAINILLTLQLLNLVGTILVPLLLAQIFNLPGTALFAVWACIPFTVFLPYTVAACAVLRFLQAASGKSPCKCAAIHWLPENGG